jgi:hypothetical protein
VKHHEIASFRDKHREGSVLNELSIALRCLHKALLDSEAEHFGQISGPLELLNLAVHHEHFAWLRGMSELMVEIDEARDSGETVSDRLRAAIRASIEELVGPRTLREPHFRERYAELLQQSPAVVMAHGDLRRVLDKMPNIAIPGPSG